MVIATEGYCDVAVWGGLMTAGAYARGFAGAILDGGVRDVLEIRRDYDFPVYARSISPGSTVGRYRTLGKNLKVTIGGVEVNPGDLIVADVDGIVAVPRDRAAEVLAMSQEIDRREAEQAKLIVESKSLKEGLAKYGRI
jgi:regulator of RNase E activity RraA